METVMLLSCAMGLPSLQVQVKMDSQLFLFGGV